MPTSSFDPYHKWLGIPPREQPPNHYRLLGIPQFESDLDVIESGADRQTIALRSFQIGPNAEIAERLLNEVAEARICLLKFEEKEQYDRTLETPPRTVKVPTPPVLVTPPLLPPPLLSSTPTRQPRNVAEKPHPNEFSLRTRSAVKERLRRLRGQKKRRARRSG